MLIFFIQAIGCAVTTVHEHEVVDYGPAEVGEEPAPTVAEEVAGVVPDAEEQFSVPDGALLVYDVSGSYPFLAWTDPISEMGSLDPELLFFTNVEPSEAAPEEDLQEAGSGGDERLDDTGVDDDSIPLTTLMFAYVGDIPIESVSVEYAGVLSSPSGVVPPPGYSSYQYGSTTQRRIVVTNDSSGPGTVYFQHKHSSSTSYHALATYSVSSGSCVYAYDCVYSQQLRFRVYSTYTSDWDDFSASFKTSCSASCY